ncbi:MAG TPA: PEP-utilizing enzyme, partial [Polyangiales bacterium]|nr:PEP-utilizing enzyme [Polyangiales bacterium]
EPLPPVSAAGVVLTEDPAQPLHALESAQTGQDARAPRRVSGRVICAGLGLGSPVIEGGSAYDLVRVSASGELVEARIAAKKQQRTVTAQGARIAPVPHAKSVRPALDEHALRGLLDAATKLESSGAGARKVDFLVLREGGVRVTAVERTYGTGWPEGGGASTVWSRAAVTESLPGVPSPLTGSLAEQFETQDLRDTLLALGCKVPRSGALVRRVYGRYYVNLSVLAPALCEVPGIEAAALAGVVGSEAAQALRFQSERGSGTSSLARLPVAAARLLAQQRSVADQVQRFEREAQQQRRWLAEMDLAILPDDALKTTLLETYDFFQRTSRLLLTSSVLVLASHTGLKAVMARSSPVQAERLAQRVTSGVGDLDSSALGVALAHVTAIADKDAAARECLLGAPLRGPHELPQGPTRRALQQFLEAYGDRAIRESELMTARFSESPEPVLAMITAGLTAEAVDPDERLSLARVLADRELAALEARLPYVEKVLVRALLSRARIFIRLREHMRIWMARTLNMLRIVTLDVDRRLRRLDSTLTPGAAFFCTFEELVSAVGSYRVDLGPLVRLRRDSYARDAARLDPPETFVGRPGPLTLPPLGSVVLHGAGCSPGVVTGRARLVGPRGLGIAGARRGEILVMRSLDVALAPLFLLAGGLVCETGSVLSHGAVLAREYGLPAVAGVPAVTTTVQDGERLRVDGDRGVVERLDA